MSCPVYIINHAVRCLPCDDKQFISRLILNLFNFTAFIESKLCINVMSSLTTYFNDFSQCNLYLAVVLKAQRDHYTYQEKSFYVTRIVLTFCDIAFTITNMETTRHSTLQLTSVRFQLALHAYLSIDCYGQIRIYNKTHLTLTWYFPTEGWDTPH